MNQAGRDKEQLICSAQIQERESVFRHILHTAHQTLDVAQLFQAIVDELGSLLLADRCLLVSYNPQKQCLEAPVCEYRALPEIPSLADITTKLSSASLTAIRDMHQPFGGLIDFDIQTNGLSEETRLYFKQKQMQSCLLCCIAIAEDCLAFLLVDHVQEKWLWSTEERVVIQDIAALAAIAIHRIQLFHQTQKSDCL